MPFHEKSAWIVSAALLLGGAFYFAVVAAMSSASGRLAPPTLPLVAAYTVLLVIAAVAGHIVAALAAPKEANTPLDEREKTITHRAGHLSGYVIGAGVIVSLGLYLFSYDGNLLFYAVFATLMLSQLAEYALQIRLYRSAL